MKKKRSFLTIISSILGVSAVCGLFALSILDHNKTQRADAVSFEIDHQYFTSTSQYIGNYEFNIGLNNYEFRDTLNGPSTIYFNGNSYLVRNTIDDNITYDYSYDVTITMFANSHLNTAFVLRDLGFDGSNNFRININGFSTKYLNVSLRLNTLYFTPVDTNRYYATLKFDFYDVDSGNLLASPSNTYYINMDYALPQYTDVKYNMEYNHVVNGNVSTMNYGADIPLVNSNFTDINDDNIDAFDVGYSSGYNDGYNAGNGAGYNAGFNAGYNQGVADEQNNVDSSYSQGYAQGYNDGLNSDSTANTIFNGILTIGMLPVNFFLSIFNFEILGINLSGFIRAIFTVMLTIIVIKLVMGASSGGGE